MAEEKGNKVFAKRLLGLLTLIFTLTGAYSSYNVVAYLLNPAENNAYIFSFYMEVLAASAFLLTLAYIVYEEYFKFKS